MTAKEMKIMNIYKTITESAIRLCHPAVSHKAICLLLAAALLMVWQVRAQAPVADVDKLIRQMKSQDLYIRQQAVIALGEIGPEAKEAVPALIDAFKDPDEDVR